MALTYGMSNKEFWEEDPNLLWAYRKSYEQKFKITNELNNYNFWLQGLYIFDAINRCLYNALGRKSGEQPLQYVEEPYDINSKPKSEEELKKEKRKALEAKIKERNEKIKEILKNSKK